MADPITDKITARRKQLTDDLNEIGIEPHLPEYLTPTALNATIAGAEKFDGKNGQPFIQIDPAGEASQSILELSPPADGQRVKLDFWSAPVGVAGRQRTMSIESHGTNDPYNPENNHNSVYTTDTTGAYVHVVDWDWGPTYDGLIHFPTMKLVAHQDGSFDKNVGVGTRTPAPSVVDGRVLHINSPVAGKTAELKQTSGTVDARVITYSTKTFVGTYSAHDTVLIAGGEANANLTLKADGRAGFAKSLGIGTTAPAPATAGRVAVHLTDATGVEYRAVSGTVSLRMAAVAAGAAQFGADSAHDLTLYAGGLANGQVRMGASGGLGFFNASPTAKATISGSRSDGTALANLLAEFALKGLIVNSTTA